MRRAGLIAFAVFTVALLFVPKAVVGVRASHNSVREVELRESAASSASMAEISTSNYESTPVGPGANRVLSSVSDASQIQVIVQTNPSGRAFFVDGTKYSTTQTFSWVAGSAHSLAAEDQIGDDWRTQFNWTDWSDGLDRSHGVSPSSSITYTANFRTQYYLDFFQVGMGDIGLSNFHLAGQKVGIEAATLGLSHFAGWIGTGPGSYTGPYDGATVTMNGPITETAVFVTSPVQFSSASYSVSEGARFATVTVTRTGDLSFPGSVRFETVDGTATQTRDYTAASGILKFGPGESSKDFTVLVTDNAYIDGNRTLQLWLFNPKEVVIGGSYISTLTVTDNDISPPVANPIDNSDARFFVQQHYSDFLNRLPDQGGFDFWVNQITQCGGEPTCIRDKRIDVSDAFFFEPEYQQTAGYVFRLYRAVYGNNQTFSNPDNSNPVEAKKIPNYFSFSRDRAWVLGGTDLAQSQLDLANSFGNQGYPDNLDGPGFVDAVLQRIKNDSGADLTSQRAALLSLYNSGGRGAVFYRLADDNVQTNPIDNRAFIDAEYNRTFVATQYFGYLRRDPDMAGFLFWLSQIDNAPVRDVPKQHAMVCSFLTSTEYQLRFSSVVTHSNAECPQ